MSEPFLGEIEFFPFLFAPKGWMTCAGQILLVSQNSALFSLLGVNFGGDGVQTFALPDLRGRVCVTQGQGTGLSSYTLGQVGGLETMPLTLDQIPAHTHLVGVVAAPPNPAVGTPAGNMLSAVSTTVPVTIYGSGPTAGTMSSGTVGNGGGGQAHENRMPYLPLNACIAVAGIYPPRP